MRSSSTFSVLFWVYGKRAVKNQANIYVRITVNGKRVNISLKKKIDLSIWDEKSQRAKGSSRDSRMLNLFLNEVQSKIYRIYEGLKLSGNEISSQTIKSKFLGEDKKHFSFQELIDYYNEKMQHKLHKNTLGHYKTSQRYMMQYIVQEYNAKDIALSTLDFSFLVGFEGYLRSFTPKSGQFKIGNNTAMKHIKRLRTMVKLAYQMEWIQRDPFVNFKIKLDKSERAFLTKSELDTVENLSSSIERLDIVKDLFVFSCYTGISYVDMMSLTNDNIITGIDNKPWIMGLRQKTGVPFQIPILSQTNALIKKYKSHSRTAHNNCLLPTLSNQKLNSYLKEIADLCGIKKNLTFHMARHTFATTVTLSNGVPLETVSKLLGHSKITTTQIYARVIEKKVSEDMDLLSVRLDMSKSSSLT